MLRSRINSIIAEGDEFIRSFGYRLPPFAYFTPEEMVARRGTMRGILSARLGWDVTDYGQGRFDALGLFLFTVRNGDPSDLASGRGMLYAEKIMISRRDQLSPMHRHAVKAEDIVNRGGATLALQLFASDGEGNRHRSAQVHVATDGRQRRFDAGDVLRLGTGESVTLMPGIWHSFWGEGGDVLIGEVSTVNDDTTDNVFDPPLDRFSCIEEDEAPSHLLVSDYPSWLG